MEIIMLVIKKKSEITPKILNDGEASGIRLFPALTAKDGAPAFAMRLFALDPRGNTPKHSHSWEHEVFIVGGDGSVIEGDKKIPVEKEDFILVPKDELHQFIAGNNGISFICVVPNEGQPD
jgi:quercetin dioxygenase-like cupin family protein